MAIIQEGIGIIMALATPPMVNQIPIAQPGKVAFKMEAQCEAIPSVTGANAWQ